VELEVAMIPNGLDPADYVGAHGTDALRELVAQAVPLLRFSIDRRLDRWDLDRPEERARALKEAAEVLAPVKGSILADDYANYIADRLFVDFETAKRAIAAVKPQPRPATPPGEPDSAPPQPVVQVSAGDARQLRVERDVLDLYVRAARRRPRACFLLESDLLTDPRHRAIAEVIAGTDVGVSAADLVGRLDLSVPGSAELLSGATLDGIGDAEYELVEEDLLRSLKEMDLERRIRIESAWLNQNKSLKDSEQYDEVFRKVSSLQRELSELRSNVRDTGQ
jgi:DNA primase